MYAILSEFGTDILIHHVECAQNERARAFLVFPSINLLRIKDDVSL